MPFEKISQRGRWYRVRDVDGDKHWVRRQDVTAAMQCAVVKVEKANVRTGPGQRYRLAALDQAGRYYAFRIIGRSGSWIKVRDGARNQGWIARSLLWIR
jgi:SH3-like domain-containing protein